MQKILNILLLSSTVFLATYSFFSKDLFYYSEQAYLYTDSNKTDYHYMMVDLLTNKNIFNFEFNTDKPRSNFQIYLPSQSNTDDALILMDEILILREQYNTDESVIIYCNNIGIIDLDKYYAENYSISSKNKLGLSD